MLPDLTKKSHANLKYQLTPTWGLRATATAIRTALPSNRQHRLLLFSCTKQLLNQLGRKHDLLNVTLVFRDQVYDRQHITRQAALC